MPPVGEQNLEASLRIIEAWLQANKASYFPNIEDVIKAFGSVYATVVARDMKKQIG